MENLEYHTAELIQMFLRVAEKSGSKDGNEILIIGNTDQFIHHIR